MSCLSIPSVTQTTNPDCRKADDDRDEDSGFAVVLNQVFAPAHRDEQQKSEAVNPEPDETEALDANDSAEPAAQTQDTEQLVDAVAAGTPGTGSQLCVNAAQVVNAADEPQVGAPLTTATALSAEQQLPGSAQVSPGAAGQQDTAEAPISASSAEAGGEEDGAMSTLEPTEAEIAAPGKEAKPEKHGIEDENTPQHSIWSKDSSGPRQQGDALAGPNDGDGRPLQTLTPVRTGAANGAGNPDPSHSNEGLPQGSDGNAHGPQNMTVPAASDHAVRGTGHAEVHPLSRTQAANSAELPDHTFSIVRDGNRLAVQIEPGGLGKIDINLSLEHGLVTARIHVADAATRNLIENNMQQVLDALQREGVSVGGFSVALKQNGTGDGNNGDTQDHAQESNGAALQAAGGAREAAMRGRINIFI